MRVYMNQCKKVVQKNRTKHSQFQLRNLTKISEFNERTNNYFKKKLHREDN